MAIETTDTTITLSHKGASAEIYFYGAHVTSWKSAGETSDTATERFFMSKTAVLDGTGPIRGGIPIAFPIFATDKHPDYPELGGAHGFARISRWTLASQLEKDDQTSVTLTLESNDKIKALFPHAFRLEYTVSLSAKSLDTVLKITNLAKESFRFNTCLHTYYLLPEGTSLEQAQTSPLGSLPFTSRIDPSSPQNLKSSDAVSIVAETARCYHFTPFPSGNVSNEVFIAYGPPHSNEGVKVLSEKGWTDAVFWNPHEKAAKAIGDLNEGGWQEFICWEPGVIQQLKTLEAGAVWEGRQLMTAV